MDGFVRDLENQGKSHRAIYDHKGRRPVWKGPIPDRYYYIVKNKKHPTMSGAWVVRFTDLRDYAFANEVRLIANMQGGHRSLIESPRKLPVRPDEGKLLAHSKVDQVKQVLWESKDRKLPILDPKDNGEQLAISGREVIDEEIFI